MHPNRIKTGRDSSHREGLGEEATRKYCFEEIISKLKFVNDEDVITGRH